MRRKSRGCQYRVMQREWMRYDEPVRPSPPPGMERPHWDIVLSAFLFVLAGISFVLLCFVAGVTAGLWTGIDTIEPTAISAPVRTTAGTTTLVGLAVAITGLVLWRRWSARGKRLIWIAAADLLVMFALIGTVVVVTLVDPLPT